MKQHSCRSAVFSIQSVIRLRHLLYFHQLCPIRWRPLAHHSRHMGQQQAHDHQGLTLHLRQSRLTQRCVSPNTTGFAWCPVSLKLNRGNKSGYLSCGSAASADPRLILAIHIDERLVSLAQFRHLRLRFTTSTAIRNWDIVAKAVKTTVSTSSQRHIRVGALAKGKLNDH